MNEQPTPTLTEPSFTAQILRVTATLLELHPSEPVDRARANEARTVATDAIVGNLPAAVREAAETRVMGCMPVADSGTCGHYAAMLRASAEDIA